MRRGGCSFVKKVREVEHAGGKLAILGKILSIFILLLPFLFISYNNLFGIYNFFNSIMNQYEIF